jgi:predicted TPR repeat methyltransferase
VHPAAMRGFTSNLDAIGLQLRQMHDGRFLRVLDMGGQDVNGTVHDQLRDRGFGGAIDVLDIADGRGVTIVGDARRVDWWDGEPYDLVISTEMLEHLCRWYEAIDVVRAVLKPGGWFVGTCASMGRAPHGANGEYEVPSAQHYQNVHPTELIEVLRLQGFEDLHTQYEFDPAMPCTHDLYWRTRRSL